MLKKCWKCQSAKSLEQFYVDRSRSDGKQPICKVCLKLSYVDPTRRKASAEKYRVANLEKCREASKLSKRKNPELAKKWVQENIEKVISYKASNRAKRKQATGKYTGQQVSDLFELQKGKCACCQVNLGKTFHRDHITPLVAGGTNDILNIQLLCQKCNLQKGAKDPINFMQTLGYLI